MFKHSRTYPHVVQHVPGFKVQVHVSPYIYQDPKCKSKYYSVDAAIYHVSPSTDQRVSVRRIFVEDDSEQHLKMCYCVGIAMSCLLLSQPI